eukprot:TRINITY_DN3415_c0_g1_i1.p1 TRINITY_DN3415_c0_g1~~TRINITY_DN3415_c0_g1_i1.p1  ORF type:complete len:169 (-),score=18.96 TRINITY_DN3415_c0_g1_i1:140-646(-)
MGDDDGGKDRSRSRSRSNAKDVSFDERIRQLEDDIKHFVKKHNLADSVERILSTIHGRDAEDVISTPFPDDCRNKNGFVVSTVRRMEKERRRPQGYRWDKRSFSEPPRAGSNDRAGPPRRGGGSRRKDSRDPPPRRRDSRDRRPPPRRNDSRDRRPPPRRDSRDRRRR